MSFPSGSGKDDHIMKENSPFYCWYCDTDLKTSRDFSRHLKTCHIKLSFEENERKPISTSYNSSGSESKDDKSNPNYKIPTKDEIISALQALIDETKTLNPYRLGDEKEMPEVEEHNEVSEDATIKQRKEVPNYVSAKGKEIATIADEEVEEDSDDSVSM
ncbi:hypothetical protein G2W53_005163 [Senna tora]|uniref:C2H2-type domain-containing protein n=1 Tax=Senna tora TaxID=362788 RepID=A0A835CJZ4_9FABA|nr:hypothetical protein G2W53_005163 [Senna tora]